MRLAITRAAQIDQDEIWVYIASKSGNIDTANRVLETISKALYMLSRNPYMGRSRDSDLRPGLRSLPVDSYVVFYRVKSGFVRIVRVLHGSRDARTILGEL